MDQEEEEEVVVVEYHQMDQEVGEEGEARHLRTEGAEVEVEVAVRERWQQLCGAVQVAAVVYALQQVSWAAGAQLHSAVGGDVEELEAR